MEILVAGKKQTFQPFSHKQTRSPSSISIRVYIRAFGPFFSFYFFFAIFDLNVTTLFDFEKFMEIRIVFFVRSCVCQVKNRKFNKLSLIPFHVCVNILFFLSFLLHFGQGFLRTVFSINTLMFDTNYNIEKNE